MIVYSVTVTIQSEIETQWRDWMKKVHIPEVLRTGCFSECSMYKIHEPVGEQPAYVMQYRCQSLEDYHRYRETFAPALQKEHSDKFSGRFTASRLLLEKLI
ncbi:MAG TPA: DUF4286 family protein [Chthoniobacterales bacterium]|jgi:hypothetical protein